MDTKVSSPKNGSKGHLPVAYLAFQKEIPIIKMNKTVEFGQVKFNYASLDAIINIVRPLLAKHGLFFYQKTTDAGEIMTVIVHAATGESFDGACVEMRHESAKDMKTLGAHITYARRYSLGTTLGIVAEEDKDVGITEEQGKKSQKFAFNTAKKSIDGMKTTDDAQKKAEFLTTQLGLVDSGKVSSMGLNKKQLEELLELANKKGKELMK